MELCVRVTDKGIEMLCVNSDAAGRYRPLLALYFIFISFKFISSMIFIKLKCRNQ